MKQCYQNIRCDCGRIECDNIVITDQKPLGISKVGIPLNKFVNYCFCKPSQASVMIRDRNGVLTGRVSQKCYSLECKNCRNMFYFINYPNYIVMAYPHNCKSYNSARMCNNSQYEKFSIPHFPLSMLDLFLAYIPSAIHDYNDDENDFIACDIDDDIMFVNREFQYIVGSYEDRPMLDEFIY